MRTSSSVSHRGGGSRRQQESAADPVVKGDLAEGLVIGFDIVYPPDDIQQHLLVIAARAVDRAGRHGGRGKRCGGIPAARKLEEVT